ncbi:MAG TPA: T9SS type A sorting domain-containing protein [Bacteroidia bacterium]|nr:T9SS type A sorting domain-containing protein [Bacteroidia bacterium]
MNKKLQKQIKAYAGFAGTILASSRADAQVVYTDVVPDDSTFESYAYLDMNNDGINEVITSWSGSGAASGYSGDFFGCYDDFLYNLNGQIFRLINGTICCNAGGNLSDLKNFSYAALIGNVLPPNTVLDSRGRFFNNSFSTTNNGNTNNCFAGNFIQGWGDKYIGIKFPIAGINHYGWIRVEAVQINNWVQIILKDYAYETAPDVPILAGSINTISGTQELFNSSIKIFAENKKIKIELLRPFGETEISVFNLLGEEIFSGNTTKSSEEISIANKGIYLVRVSNEKFTLQKKVSIF